MPKSKNYSIATNLNFAFFRSILFSIIACTAFTMATFYSAESLGAGNGQSLSKSESDQVAFLMGIDRISYYAELLGIHLRKQGKEEIAQAISELKPEDFYKMSFSLQDLNNPEKFDGLVLATLKKKFKSMEVKIKDINWEYNFLKRKLAEAFRIAPIKSRPSLVSSEGTPDPFQQAKIDSNPHSPVLIDSELYIAEKTTRAVYWDSVVNNREIEFHLGTEADFRMKTANKNDEIVAEIKPRARNYNKIYLCRDSKGSLYYAFTRISGGDRLDHLARQLRLVSLNGKFALPLGRARVYGSVKETHYEIEETLTAVLERLPKADVTIIGQKGAFENALQIGAKVDALGRLISDSSNTPPKKQAAELTELLELAEKSNFDLIDHASEVKEKFGRYFGEEVINLEQSRIEMASHEFSDYVLETKSGKTIRLRLFSNVWGDEIHPIARAISKTKTEKVIYIGTAGAMDGRGYSVGDLVSPQSVLDKDGKPHTLSNPTFARGLVKSGGTLSQVKTPFEETNDWFEAMKSKGAHFVELETDQLRLGLNGKVPFEVYLLISDIVGTKESLAHASSNSGRRKTAQLSLIKSIFSNLQVTSTREVSDGEKGNMRQKLYDKINEIFPNRDDVFKLFAVEKAIEMGLNDKKLETELRALSNFNRRDAFLSMAVADQIIEHLLSQMSDSINPNEIYVSKDFYEGRWNPEEPLLIGLKTKKSIDAKAETKLDKILQEVNDNKSDHVSITTFSSKPVDGWKVISLNKGEVRQILTGIYSAMALKRGFVTEPIGNGDLKLRKVRPIQTISMCKELLK